jgi:membrane protein
MMTIALWLFVLYLSLAEVNSALQAAGTAAVFLIGFYFLAQIFVIGAVITRVYAAMFGSKIVPTPPLRSHQKD